MRIGYSFWGFLGPGVLDTPDGGRSHRRTFVDGLIAAGHDIVFLQANRDLHEADHDLRSDYRWNEGLPELDALFLEWRWPIPGRNTTGCAADGHTCDLHRQAQLVDHYSITLSTPTLLWDKDLRLPPDDPLRARANVSVCEAALRPASGATSLLFPVDDRALAVADPAALAARPRTTQLAYVGNQYDRDETFTRFLAPAAPHLRHRVAGKWTNTGSWPRVNFTGRCTFTEVETIYSGALATVLLLPDRYAQVGQMTQRIVEAVSAGCLPLTPTTVRDAERFAPARLHVRDGLDVVTTIRWLGTIAGTSEHADLIGACLHRLGLFRLSTQVRTVEKLLNAHRTAAQP
jgi:hypothetical protein